MNPQNQPQANFYSNDKYSPSELPGDIAGNNYQNSIPQHSVKDILNKYIPLKYFYIK